jgi:hypothetical protein
MSANSAKSRFDRALVELQVGLKVLPIGVAETGAWHYAFIYEILQRYFPTLPEQARVIRRSQAQQTLIETYLNSVVSADRGMIKKVFHVMKWTSRELTQAIDGLLARDVIREVQVEGLQSPQLMLPNKDG